MQAVLVMFRSDGERRSFSITRDMTVIGRREDCDLRIPLGEVSRKHCRLVRDGDSLKVEDLGSSNGTFLNGRRVQEAQLTPGDSVQVGPVVFVLQVDGVPADDELAPVSLDAAGAGAGTAAGSGLDEAADGSAAAGGAEAVEELEPLDELEEQGDAPVPAAAAAAGGGDEPEVLEPLDELEPLEQDFDITEEAPAGSSASGDVRLDLDPDEKRG